MLRRIGSFLGPFVVLSIGYLTGFYFFGHLFASEAGNGRPPVPFFPAFAISNALLVAFFLWVTRQMESPFKAAFAIAGAQFLLVDFVYVMTGSRTVAAGAASTLVMLYTWTLVALTHRAIVGRPPTSPAGSVAPPPAPPTPPDRRPP